MNFVFADPRFMHYRVAQETLGNILRISRVQVRDVGLLLVAKPTMGTFG